ncbi:MAG: sulfite exporter TauE/SafE family protein [Chthoniobacterales bacterium]|nr:sulfite exporter TauE/SafE family protein [Chthoniobacterales bacterium]
MPQEIGTSLPLVSEFLTASLTSVQIFKWLGVLAAAFVGATVAAIAGTGGGVLLLPVLVWAFGVRAAVPLYTVCQLLGNLSRVGWNWREIRLKVVAWFSLGSVPGAILGAWLFTQIPDVGLLKFLGAFLLATAIYRWFKPQQKAGFSAPWFVAIGSAFSLVSALVGSAGPFLAPFYLAFGLVKGAFIGTEALGTAILHIVKLSMYQGLGAMEPHLWLQGLMLGPVMIGGTYLGKQILEQLSTTTFLRIVEFAIAAFGIWFLFR